MKFDNVNRIDTKARWIDYPMRNGTVARFLMRHVDVRSPYYQRIKTKHQKPYRKLIEVEALPPARDREIAVAAFVEAALEGWEGITSGGEPVPFTAEAAQSLLTQDAPLFYGLLGEAAETGNYELGEGDVKN